MQIRSGAIRDFPFADLPPEDFHRLALHLLERDPGISSVENHGARGADGGIDLIAEPTRSDLVAIASGHTERIRILVQVKRVKAFTKTSARKEIERLRSSGSARGFKRYLLVTSCVPSAASLKVLRQECAALGIGEVAVWEASLLTARLLEHRDLLEFFFGISDPNAWLRDPNSASRYLGIHRLIAKGHPLLLVVGSRPAFDFAPSATDGDSSPGDSLRWLIENRVVDTIVAQGADFGLTLGDLLPMSESDRAPTGPVLWQPPPDLSLGRLVSGLLEKPADRAGPQPVLAVLGCDEPQLRSLREHRADLERLTAGDGLMFFDNPEAPNLLPGATSLNGQIFLRSLHELAAPDWLTFHLRQVDFSEPYGFEDMLAGRPVAPGIARTGQWPAELEEHPSEGKPLVIADLPGTGKTARGYRTAYKLSPEASFYLDLATVPAVTTSDLGRLILTLERQQCGGVLLLDNAQTARGAADRLVDLLRQRAKPSIQVIVMFTEPFSSLEMLGGEIMHSSLDDKGWRERRASLSQWSATHLGSHPEDLRTAERDASNLWHFFYLLRGGATKLKADLDEAHADDSADTVWYLVAALQVFLREPATVRTIFAGLTERDLWPLTVDAGARGRWLVGRIASLLESRRIMPAADGFVCRHPYEAFGVLRLSFDFDHPFTPAPYREASIRFFQRAMPRIVIPEKLRGPPDELVKGDFVEFGYIHVRKALERQREIEQAVSYDPELQAVVDEVWEELMQLVESWPIHPLYWLFNYGKFTWNMQRFSPFNGLESLGALQAVEHDGDAVDLEYVIKGLLSHEAHRTARYRANARNLRQRAEADLGVAEIFLDDAESAKRRIEERQPGLEDPVRLDVDRKMLELTEEGIESWAGSIESLKSTIAETKEMEGKSISVPASVGFDEGSTWDLVHSARWLDYHRGLFAKAIAKLDSRKLLKSMKNLQSAQPLLLANLWLLSPKLGRELFEGMKPKRRQRVVDAIENLPDSYYLHFSESDDFLALFVSELAEAAPEVSSWLAAGNGGEIGERIRGESRESESLLEAVTKSMREEPAPELAAE